MNTIDLNCDAGESFGAYHYGADEQLIPFVSSINIACGVHAGDPTVIRTTIQSALEHGVAIGAHPGLPDREGFGRRHIAISFQDCKDSLVYQIGALQAVTRAYGGELHHVKLHGALYFMAMRQEEIAQAVIEAVALLQTPLYVYTMPFGELYNKCLQVQQPVVTEGFADRLYTADGYLRARTFPDALLTTPQQIAQQACSLVLDRHVTTADGTTLPLHIQTICLHSDTPYAAQAIQAIHSVFKEHKITIQPYCEE